MSLSPIRPLPLSPTDPRPPAAARDDAAPAPPPVAVLVRQPLRLWQSAAAFAMFVAWLALFGAGIMVDSGPYRRAISPEGAQALSAEGQRPDGPAAAPGGAVIEESPAAPLPVAPSPAPAEPVRHVPLWQAWAVVLTCFLPLNLAWLCVASSTLGAIGNLANLGSDGDARSASDSTNPLLSAILRGFFVYLFLMSGLLLLDHAPFSNAGPSQYIRLAGFLSLFSFVVSYHPQLFGALIVSAFERIQVRSLDRKGSEQVGSAERVHVRERETEVQKETFKLPAEPGAVAPDRPAVTAGG